MKPSKPLNFILIGRSGSGKGTQIDLLMKHFGPEKFFSVSSGDLFRSLSQCETDVGKRVKKVVEGGGLPLDFFAITLWLHEIAFKMKENQGLIADGFPRRIEEAQALDRLMDFLERQDNTFYLLVDISREESFNRLTKRRICTKCATLIPWVGDFKSLKACHKCGGELETRPDDKPEAIENRLNYYEKSVVPVVKYYEDSGRLIKINGEQPIEDVFKDVLKAINVK